MKQTDVKVPPILLEGDQPPAAPEGDEAEKFAVGPPSETAQRESTEPTLSKDYRTGGLFLMARDPNCLYAHWDLTVEQERDVTEQSDRRLQVRVYLDDVTGPVVKEFQVEAGSRHSFIEVGASGARYVAELGYEPRGGAWQRLAVSAPVATPADTTAQHEPIRFATMAFNAAAENKAEPIPEAGLFAATATAATVPAETPAPPTETLERKFPLPPPLAPLEATAQETGEIQEPKIQPAIAEPVVTKTPPAPPTITALTSAPSLEREWTPARERALAKMIGWSFLKRGTASSAEIAELLKREFQETRIWPPDEFASLQGAKEVAISSEGLGALPSARGFWFNVNAELVIYGATETSARVRIAGQPVELRPDGTFSCRFALPDGFYQLGITATSAQGDVRAADLDFLRASAYCGQVGPHPQDPALKPPLAEPPAEH
jgi:hypothetical protein